MTALLILVIIGQAVGLALVGRRLRLLEGDFDRLEGNFVAYGRDREDFEDRVDQALDTLDAEVGAATDAERIMERAQRRQGVGARVYEVPLSRWSRQRRGDRPPGRRVTGVLLAVAVAGSAAVLSRLDSGHSPDPERARRPATTSDPPAPIASTSTSIEEPVPATLPLPPATEPPVPTSSTTPTTVVPPVPTTTTLPRDLGSFVLVLQLGDELPASVLGEGAAPDLADIIAAEVGDKPAEITDALDVIARCSDGDVAGSAEDVARLDLACLSDQLDLIEAGLVAP